MLILIICHSLERNYKMLQKMYPLFKDLDNSKVLIETRNVFAKILYHATIQSTPHLRTLKIFVNCENIW